MTNWPDPARPGVPLNPERDGWHWVENKFTDDRRAALWLTDLQWGWRGRVHEMAEACIYLGPCLTPDEAAALQMRVAELEATLRSIASNTCCDRCQEAALVARAALAGGKDE